MFKCGFDVPNCHVCPPEPHLDIKDWLTRMFCECAGYNQQPGLVGVSPYEGYGNHSHAENR
eukprot:1421033-Alexandrium_andersonii.AAC.1